MYKNEAERYKSKYATIGTKGRAGKLPEDLYRTDFQRDTHRVLYSQSFRRLRHKTQVFYFPQNDHVSTRLDHVLFVASGARAVARCLDLNEDLAEAIGLAHDIGHAPFGHQGEVILNEIIKKYSELTRALPCFCHEIYGLRVVDKIAKLDRERPGLNLTWEVRDGIISHCGEDFKTCKLVPDNNTNKNLEHIFNRETAGKPTTLEGCIVRLVDKVAYCGKDIEDAIALGIINSNDIPEIIKAELGNTNGRIVGTILKDIIKESKGKDHIAISQKYGDLMHELIKFNCDHIYHSPKSEGYNKQAKQTLSLLFSDLLEKINVTKRLIDYTVDSQTPLVYQLLKQYCDEYCNNGSKIYSKNDPNELIALDFIAGMTDSFAVRSFQDLFVPKSTV